jgi:CheY-like chemotaxis protein
VANAPLRGRRALVVEDESLVAMLVEDILLDLGAKVEVAMRLCEALRQAREGVFDFAILDVNLGNGDRSDAVADVLAARRIPFVFATGYGERGLAAQYLAIPTLQKPYHQRDLELLIERVLPAGRPSADIMK